MAKKKYFRDKKLRVIVHYLRSRSTNYNESFVSETNFPTSANILPCVGNCSHHFRSAFINQLVTRSGCSYRIINAPVQSCDNCQQIMFDEKTILKINEQITKLELRSERKGQLIKELSNFQE